ncbi:hypothetical protein DSM112329_05063 [Paraconexibacter sp. AEG42_29]|uniref:Thioesterase family protein n=1 Tax=Paraconexibacter sp. AEG42_29 TaxID=2997339 RepID=A0AAU7B2R3_9ACTN
MSTLRIPARFNGPPTTANGGYAAGRLAAHLPAAAAAAGVSVRLRRPPALDRDLTVAVDGGTAELRDGEDLVATATAMPLDLAVPDLPSLEEARAAASAADRTRPGHPFPSCFGCGPDRDRDEAVAALLAAVPGRQDGLWACTWTPPDGLPHHADGTLEDAIVWVALDCPSAQPVAPDGGAPHVLGTLTARLDHPVRVGVEHLLLAWPLGRDGRKAHSAAAVVAPDGTICARSRALWIALPSG